MQTYNKSIKSDNLQLIYKIIHTTYKKSIKTNLPQAKVTKKAMLRPCNNQTKPQAYPTHFNTKKNTPEPKHIHFGIQTLWHPDTSGQCAAAPLHAGGFAIKNSPPIQISNHAIFKPNPTSK